MNDTASSELFSALDMHFARFITGISNSADERLFWAVALLSRSTRAGDVCLDLASLAGQALSIPLGDAPSWVCPPLSCWIQVLRATSAVGEPGQKKPLILDDGYRLYLYRYWDYECRVARFIQERMKRPVGFCELEFLQQGMQRLFPPTRDGSDESQRLAAALALLQPLCVITGGPGTGKTFTIAKVLALIAELSGKRPVRTLLAAPTGKAAARLRESLQQARMASEIQRRPGFEMPTDVLTLHRLLKPIPGSPYFRHNRSNPLAAEVVIVDEASMVDLALMAKLMDAVPREARLILVGDKNQLASVEAGSVLGDICDRDRPHGVSAELSARLKQATGIRLTSEAGLKPGLPDCIVELRKSYRFLPGSGIGALSRAVNQGDARWVFEILSNDPSGCVSWLEPAEHPDVEGELEKLVLKGYRTCFETRSPASALDAFQRFKILCAYQSGPLGVQALNRLAERVLKRAGLIEASGGHPEHWYAGRPVLITRNDHALGLFNGDLGIALPDPGSAGGPLFVFFQSASGGFRRFLPYQLPEHETAYAMTVHKSQGSEFDEIFLILPDRDSPILTRELIYTALTRSRQSIGIWGRRRVLAACIQRRIERASGLRDVLWNN